ncbi:hypothetical protein [Mucilaginibacter pedocola]|uniref:Uncharacterized protein n=1 Tax=Mucilaginibacter pedocola TaxID=1792845 RepID=A0A1S9PMC9_9SPHI|nr:hypothetical protein [Mucilaginibacter pedocola]OOQ62112.1 hypothetical protein BC343_03420 [Mucilaginibacter pedocola]
MSYVDVDLLSNDEGFRIIIMLSGGYDFKIKLVKPIIEYKNIDWITGKSLTHITTGFQGYGALDKTPLMLPVHKS